MTEKNAGTISIRVRYALIFTAILVASLAVILLVNRLFLERFYNRQQVRAIDAVYEELSVMIREDEETGVLRSELNDLTEQYGMSIIVMTDDASYLSLGAERTENFLLGRLYGYRNGDIVDVSDLDADDLFDDDRVSWTDQDDSDDDHALNAGQAPVPGDSFAADPSGMDPVPPDSGQLSARIFAVLIDDRDDYDIYRSYDDFSGNQYLEAWGSTDEHHTFLIRMPLESISRSADISNRFFLIVGVVVTVVGLFVSFLFLRRITDPIVDLTRISEKMSEQDFSVRYQGGYTGELDVLGTSMNTMADRLEESIDELKTANEGLKESLAYREKMDGMRGEFISAISHDLKTPIALIQGYAEGLKDGLADDPESRDYYCEVISDEAIRMNAMVQKFIALNELEYGSDGPALGSFDIAEILQDTVSYYSQKAETEGVELRCMTEHAAVLADGFMVEEALNNYLSNAFHYVQDVGSGKKILLKSESIEDEHVVRVSVWNTGAGIAEEDLGRIWDKMYRSDRARSREYGGNGIGLSIVKAIMDRHGTGCGVYNTDEGPVFWFDLKKE